MIKYHFALFLFFVSWFSVTESSLVHNYYMYILHQFVVAFYIVMDLNQFSFFKMNFIFCKLAYSYKPPPHSYNWTKHQIIKSVNEKTVSELLELMG